MLDLPESPSETRPLDGPPYLSRELTLLQFHQRVLDQARGAAHPLLERVKFLAISDSNLDEFLSIHFSLLLGNVELGGAARTPDGFTQAEQLRRVREALVAFMIDQRQVFHRELVPELAAAGIHFRRYADLRPAQQATLRDWFMAEVFPICTPLAVDPAHPFPFISNMSLNFGVVLSDPHEAHSFARIKVPAVLPRLVRAPAHLADGKDTVFVWLEDIMANNLDAFFPGVEVQTVCLFRLMRDADLELQQIEAADLRELVQAGVRRRRFGETVSIQLEALLPPELEQELIPKLDVYAEDVSVVGGPLGLRDLMQLLDLDRPDLKDPALVPRLPAAVAASKDFFSLLRKGDLLLHHPYEPFRAVQDFIEQAAADPDVLAIKQTLYRVGRTSPLVQSLLEAVYRGKQVAVVLELQARGDEENNIEWAETLEHEGAHVSYGVIGLKTHVKLSLVVRREPDGLRRYVHLGTGNYSANPYADLSLFTCHPDIGEDVTELFNVLTGRSRQHIYRQLLVAPYSLRNGIIDRIDREIERHQRHNNGHLIFKTNALVDLPVIDALYRASRAGVRVDLIVRGMSCLRPGVPGVSDNIRLLSIVGRFLEHSRVFWFHNGGDQEVLIGSADMMERNLDRRVEALTPVLDPRLVATLKERVLDLQLTDNVRATELGPDGIYRPVPREPGAPPIDSQLIWVSSDLSLMP